MINRAVIQSTIHRQCQVLFMLVLISMYANLIVNCNEAFAYDDCAPIKVVTTSENINRNLISHVMHQVCASGFGSGSEEFWVTVTDSKSKSPIESRVFHEFSPVPPEIHWGANGSLYIKIIVVSDIDFSIKEYENIEINYSIAKILENNSFNAKLCEFRKRMISEISGGQITLGGSSKSENIALLDKNLANQIEDYLRFALWVKKNNAVPTD